MGFFRTAYLSPARSWLRRLGLIRIFSLTGEARTRWRHLQYQWGKPRQVKARIGQWEAELHVADADEYARALSFHEDRHVLQFLLGHVLHGDMCWDVGANVGLYALFLARAAGEGGAVIAFEPEGRACSRLIQNAALNHLKNIKVMGFALGRTNTRMRLSISGHYSSGSHRLIAEGENLPSALIKGPLVEVMAGDHIRKKEDLKVPSVIKIDVEGMEEDVLGGLNETLRHPACRCVVCEVHFSILEARGFQGAPKRIEQHLRECGFNRAVWLDHSHLGAWKAKT